MKSESDTAGAELASGTDSLRASMRELNGLADGFGRAMTTAFRRSVIDGKRLQDVLKSLALGLSSKALTAALNPIGQGIGGLISGWLGGAAGAQGMTRSDAAARTVRASGPGSAVGPGRARAATPFARGGGVATPRYFPSGGRFGDGTGATWPEAILPPARSPDGGEGVLAGGARAGGGRGVSVTFNVQTRDADSFRRAEAEVTAMLARAVARGQRGI